MSSLPHDSESSDIFSHLLDYQQTEDFQRDVAAQSEAEAQQRRDHYRKNAESVKRGGAKYRKNHPDLVKMREQAEKHKPLLYEQQQGLCAYCNQPLGDRYKIDHRIPLIKGGTNDLANLCVCHVHCNRKKHTKTVEQKPLF